MPDKVGLYQNRCMESNNEWSYVAVTQSCQGLMVHDSDVGVHSLKTYCDGLTDLEWRFII